MSVDEPSGFRPDLFITPKMAEVSQRRLVDLEDISGSKIEFTSVIREEGIG